ncbi:hypothetical protein R6Q59_010486 [Mikania micrantha]
MLLPRLLHDEVNSKRIDYKEHEGTNGKSITASSRNIRLCCFFALIVQFLGSKALISMTDVNHHHPKAISDQARSTGDEKELVKKTVT